MKKLLLIPFLILGCCLYAQDELGGSLSPVTNMGQAGVARALIIGISDYQDTGIPDLKYATKDAEAFAKFLHSPSGGSIQAERVRLLLDQKATGAQVNAALEWLLEETREGDTVIIYFSGHGDMKAKILGQLGYLLLWDTPPHNYLTSALSVNILQSYISTYSLQKGATVWVFADACRSGKMADSGVIGTQLTNANLATQFANETKFLSCQSDEYSIEGEQWGGGRGVFSYFLIDGLLGRADADQDNFVSLLEIKHYLEDHVPVDVAPISQIPVTKGDPKTIVARSDPMMMGSKTRSQEDVLPKFTAVEQRGLVQEVLAKTDSSILQLYQAYVKALDEKRLLHPANNCADYYFTQLIRLDKIRVLHPVLRRNYAASLQDDAQQALNAYLKANPTELQKRYEQESDYDRFPAYLHRAAEILGEQNYYYPYLMAKLNYFEGLLLRLEANQHPGQDSLYRYAIQKQQKALSYQQDASFVWNELGVLHTRLKQDDKAVECLEKAIELEPDWGLPYVNYSVLLFYTGNYEKAIKYGEKALTFMPDYPQAYNFLGWIYADIGRYWIRKNWNRQGLELQDNFLYHGEGVGMTLNQSAEQYNRTIELLEQAIQIDSQFFSAYCNLGILYQEFLRIKDSEACFDRAIQINPASHVPYYHLGFIYSSQGKLEEAEKAYLKGFSMLDDPYSEYAGKYHNSLGLLYRQWEKIGPAIEQFQKIFETGSYYQQLYAGTNLVFLYIDYHKYKEAEYQALQKFSNEFLLTSFDCGVIYTFEKRYEEAEWMLNRVRRSKPDHRGPFGVLPKIYVRSGQWEKAKKIFKQTVEVFPEEAFSYRNIGKYYYLKGETGKSESNFQKAVQIDKQAGGIYSIKAIVGHFYRIHDETDKSREYLQRSIDDNAGKPTIFRYMPSFYFGSNINLLANPALTSAHWNLAWLHLETGLTGEALQIFDEAIAFDPSHAFSYYGKALIYYFSGQHEEADNWFEKAAGLDPKYSLARQACAAMQKDEPAAAVRLMKNAIEILNDDNLRYLLCQLYVSQEKYGEALKMLEYNLLANDAGFALAQTGARSFSFIQNDSLLQSLQQTQGYQQLMRRYFPEKFDDLDTFAFKPEEGEYYLENCLLLARIHRDVGRPQEAERLLHKAIELTQDTVSGARVYHLAKAWLLLGRVEEARRICPDQLESSIKEDAQMAAEVYYLLKDDEKAALYFKKYSDLANYSAGACLNIARFYAVHGAFGEALPYFQKALTINPGFMEAYQELAWLHFAAGNYKQAVQYLNKAENIRPDDRVTRYINVIFSYFSAPRDTSRSIFSETEKAFPGFSKAWEFLEKVHLGQYEEALRTYDQVISSFPERWNGYLRHVYLTALVQSGDLEMAVSVLNETERYFLPYPMISSHPLPRAASGNGGV